MVVPSAPASRTGWSAESWSRGVRAGTWASCSGTVVAVGSVPGAVVVVAGGAVVVVVGSWTGPAALSPSTAPAGPGSAPQAPSSDVGAVVVVVAPGAVVVLAAPGAVVGVVAPGVRGRRRRAHLGVGRLLRLGDLVLGELGLLQHRPEPQLGGLAHEGEGAVAVLHPRQLDDDGVALAGDVGLGHTEGVDPVADDGERLVELLVGRVARGGEHDRHTALQVETELGAVARHEGGDQAAVGRDQDQDEREVDLASHQLAAGDPGAVGPRSSGWGAAGSPPASGW